MKCTRCGRESENLFTCVNLPDGKAGHVCIDCEVAAFPEQVRLDDADRMIGELTELKRAYEDLIARIGDPDAEVPSTIAAVAMTPRKALRMVEAFLRNTEQDCANILDAMSESERLRLALAKAVKREDYEKAAFLKLRLEAIEDGSNP